MSMFSEVGDKVYKCRKKLKINRNKNLYFTVIN